MRDRIISNHVVSMGDGSITPQPGYHFEEIENGVWTMVKDDATPLETTPSRDEEIAALAERIFERHYPKWQKNHAMQLYECASDAIFAAVEFIRARDAWMEARRDA